MYSYYAPPNYTYYEQSQNYEKNGFIQENYFPFIGRASHSLGLFPIHWENSPFIRIGSHLLGVLPIRWESFPFIGKISRLLGTFPDNRDYLSFTEIASPSINIA